jgi:hypothetical protein
MFKSISGRSGVLYSLSRTPFTIQERFHFDCDEVQLREVIRHHPGERLNPRLDANFRWQDDSNFSYEE